MSAGLQDLFDKATPDGVPTLVDSLLRATFDAGASDLHLIPTPAGADVRWRIDGVLQPVGIIPPALANNVVVRIKVMADLLTYQTQTPQEGRVRGELLPVQVRVSTFPTVHGEKLVARLFDRGVAAEAKLGELGLSEEVSAALLRALSQQSGAVVVVGPAGSGKTTTAYACLRQIAQASNQQRSIVSLEDPVEVLVPGVSQSEAAPGAGFDLATGLRSLVRQDPEVIFIGEVRDQETARIALQAAMTGQLVVTTFHSSDCATAIERLVDMSAPPYLLRSAIQVLVAQRLLRELCDCSEPITADEDATLGGRRIPGARRPVGCDSCHHTGYRGRRVVAELLDMNSDAAAELLGRDLGRQSLKKLHETLGVQTLREQAIDLVERGKTSVAEVIRTFGVFE